MRLQILVFISLIGFKKRVHSHTPQSVFYKKLPAPLLVAHSGECYFVGFYFSYRFYFLVSYFSSNFKIKIKINFFNYHKIFQVCAHLNPKTGVESGASGVDERVGVV